MCRILCILGELSLFLSDQLFKYGAVCRVTYCFKATYQNVNSVGVYPLVVGYLPSFAQLPKEVLSGTHTVTLYNASVFKLGGRNLLFRLLMPSSLKINAKFDLKITRSYMLLHGKKLFVKETCLICHSSE